MPVSSKLSAAIARYLEGSATPEEVRLVNEWYNAFNDAEVDISSAEEDLRSQVEQRIRSRLQQSIQSQQNVAVAPPRRRLRWLPAAVAAAVVALLALAYALWPFTVPEPDAWAMESTQPGEVKRLALPDGTVVWLNAATVLRYSRSFQQQRQVTVEGEAFFEVAQQPQPFTVSTASLHTTVLGTSFSVKAYPADNINVVTVVSGKVKVQAKQAGEALLTPGQAVYYNRAAGSLQRTAFEARQPSWRQGRLDFDDVPLEEIAATLSRWYNVDFRFGNPGLKHCRYTAHFNSAMPVQELLQLFAGLNSITYTTGNNGKEIWLDGKGCQ